MNKKINLRRIQTIATPNRSVVRPFRPLISAVVAGAILSAGYEAWSQTAPGLAITKTGTNEVSLTITNAILTDSYELWWTPVLGNPVDFPWATAAVGTIGQTNFSLSMNGLQTGFFYAFLDTNAIPLWEAAQPNNQAAGILTITIASPANGAMLQ